MFQGSHAINMDAKGRLAVPTRLRDVFAGTSDSRIVITAHFSDPCLVVYPETEWQSVLPKLQKLASFNKASLRIQRLMIGYATTAELDGNGRVLLPGPLREFASLDKKLMLVGLGNKLELWSEAKWLESIAATDDEPLPDDLANLVL